MTTQLNLEMPYFQWDKKYSVNVEIIDTQHKQIFKDINALIPLLDSKPSLSEVEAVVDDMIDYVEKHFTTEEKLLSKHPEFSDHKTKHKVFMANTLEFDRQLFARKPEEMALSIFNFLGSWLQNHILTEDQIYFEYLQKNSLLPPIG